MINIKGTEYKLKSIIVHHNIDADNGHFTTYIMKNNIAYHINDMFSYRANITKTRLSISCDNITDDSRTAMIIYEEISQSVSYSDNTSNSSQSSNSTRNEQQELEKQTQLPNEVQNETQTTQATQATQETQTQETEEQPEIRVASN